MNPHMDKLLIDRILALLPQASKHVLEIDCGEAGITHPLLQAFPEITYLGVDERRERLAEAKRHLQKSPFATRVTLRLADPVNLPVENESLDVVLSLMTLHRRSNILPIFIEAKRVLRADGILLVAAPDNLGQQFYFDGRLETVNWAFHGLSTLVRERLSPADIGLGPTLSAIMTQAGWCHITVEVHSIFSSRHEPASAFAGRLRRIAQQLAREAHLAATDPRVLTCERTIKDALFTGMPKRLGFSCHSVPVFLAWGKTCDR